MKILVCSFVFCVLTATTSAQTPPRVKLFSHSSSDRISDSEVYMESSLSIQNIQFTPNRVCTLGMWLLYSGPNFSRSISLIGQSELPICVSDLNVASARAFGDSTNIYRSSISFVDSNGKSEGPYYYDNGSYTGRIQTVIATGHRLTGVALYALPNYEGLKHCFQIEEFAIGRYLNNFPNETGVPADFFKSFAFEDIVTCTTGKQL